MTRSDLLEWASHEHDHVTKLFEDLARTFEGLSTGELLGQERADALDEAVEELGMALEDIMEHFTEEEEVYFVAIEQRMPQFQGDIEELVATHEGICVQIQQLEQLLVRRRGELDQLTGELDDRLRELVRAVRRHNAEEQALFDAALRQLSEHERAALLDTKRSLG